MSELHDKARALLALREQAIRGPYSAWPDAEGRVIRPHSESGERNEKTHDGSIAFVDCELDDAKMAATAQLLAAAWEMVDLISDQQTRIAELDAELVASNGAGGRWNKAAARAWRDAVLTDSASAADRLLAVSAHVAGQRFALGQSAVATVSFPDGESGVVDAAQAEQRGEAVPVATAHIDRQRLDGSWDMVARFPAPADPSSPDGLPRGGIKVYTAPPAPVVPDGWELAMRQLVYYARTSGTTAGQDPILMEACEACEKLLADAPEVPRG